MNLQAQLRVLHHNNSLSHWNSSENIHVPSPNFVTVFGSHSHTCSSSFEKLWCVVLNENPLEFTYVKSVVLSHFAILLLSHNATGSDKQIWRRPCRERGLLIVCGKLDISYVYWGDIITESGWLYLWRPPKTKYSRLGRILFIQANLWHLLLNWLSFINFSSTSPRYQASRPLFFDTFRFLLKGSHPRQTYILTYLPK